MQPPKNWRYPGQEEKYRDCPADEDYEKLLGCSELNLTDMEEFLRRTQGAVLSPEERARQHAEWKKLPMSEKMAPPVPYLSTPGLRPQESGGRDQKSGVRDQESGDRDQESEGRDQEAGVRDQEPESKDVARGSHASRSQAPLGNASPEALLREFTADEPLEAELLDVRSQAELGNEDKAGNVARPSSAEPQDPKPETLSPDVARQASRPRTPRCTKKESRRRVQAITQWLLDGTSNPHIIRACKELFGINRRMALLYIRRATNEMAEAASKVDYLAHLQKSVQQHDRMYQIASKNLDHIEDPTKVASLLRAGAAILKNRDNLMEDLNHHRRITRRDQSPDGKAGKMKRQRMIWMPFDELMERLENMRNSWFHEWNQCRILEKQREGTLRPGWHESPYDAAARDPHYRPRAVMPRVAPSGTEYCI